MTASTGPSLGLKYAWAYGEDNWNTENDANLLMVDSLLNGYVLSASTTTPPGSPTAGDKYIVPSGASGAWSGQTNKIALYVNAGWTFYTPKAGWKVYDNGRKGTLLYDGSAWVYEAAYVVNAQTGTTYTLAATDWTPSGRKIVTCTNGSSITVTCDTPTSLGVGVGESVTIVQGGAGVVTLSAGSGATLTGTAVFTTQNEAKTLVAVSTTEMRVIGAQ